MAGKGSKRRPEAQKGAFAAHWDAIFVEKSDHDVDKLNVDTSFMPQITGLYHRPPQNRVENSPND